MDSHLEVIKKDLESGRNVPSQMGQANLSFVIGEVENFYEIEYTQEAMNDHREEYLRWMSEAGYEPSQFKRPIFYFEPNFSEQLVADIIWY